MYKRSREAKKNWIGSLPFLPLLTTVLLLLYETKDMLKD